MFKIASIFLILVLSTNIFAATDAGSNSNTLDGALFTENQNSPGVVNFSQDVSLIDPVSYPNTPVQNVAPQAANTPTQVRAVNANGSFVYNGNDITINGNCHKLNGNNKNVRGFFVGGEGSSGTGSVTINNLNIVGCNAFGGAGFFLAGGGMGAGGGLFVGENTVVNLKNCSFKECKAGGGSGAGFTQRTINGSGGGMKGNAGSWNAGGFGGDGGTAQNFLEGGGGASDFPWGNAFRGRVFPPDTKKPPLPSTEGLSFDIDSVGDNGKGGTNTRNGGFGGGGGAAEDLSFGGGGFGGGSAGGFTGNASLGTAGFGGGAGINSAGLGGMDGTGQGGFGGGGALVFRESAPPEPGRGGFGGGIGLPPSAQGQGTNGLGGNGAAFGGAIFIQNGATLNIQESIAFNNNSVTNAGLRGNPNINPIAGFGTLGKDIFMMSTSTIIFDISKNVTLQNPIEGNQGDQFPALPASTTTGGLTKKGPATLTLTGTNTYTGKTTVEAGKLTVNSSLVTPIENKVGGTLSGSFNLLKDATGTNGGDLTNEGLFELSPQTNLAGTYTHESTGILECDCSPDGTISGKTYIIADAVLNGGDVRIFCGNGNYIGGTPYKVITGNVSGLFDNHFDPTLIGPNAENVQFLVTDGSYTLTLVSDFLFADIDSFSSVSRETARCLIESDHPPGSDIALAIESLGTLLAKDQDATLPTICPLLFGSLEWINARNNSYVADILADHLFELCCDPRDCCSCDCNSKVWVSVFGNMMNNQKRLDNLPRYNADAVGVLVGMDTCCSPCFTYGGALGYTRTDLLWKNDRGHGDMDSYYGALYGSWDMGCCIVSDFSLIGGGTCNDMHRKIRFANVKHTANSDFWSYFVTAHLGFRTDWNCGCSTFEPFVLGDYHYYTRESFHESGADSLNLDVKSKDQHFIRAEAGMLWYYENDCGCYCFSPYLGISYVGEFPLHKSDQRASFTGQSCVMSMTSYDSSVHLGAPQAGIKWSHCNGTSFLLGYKGLYNDSVRINELEGRFEWVF